MSRESAHLLEDALSAIMTSEGSSGTPPEKSSLTVDFDGVEGIAPSFLDEVLSIFESLLAPSDNARERRLVVANPPTRLSLKFEAIARGHGMSVRVLPDGSWLLTNPQNTCP